MSNPKTPADLEVHYRSYMNVLNNKDWGELPSFLASDVVHNGKQLGPAGYRLLIPDETVFRVDSVLADVEKKEIAARLHITVAGKALIEHVFYRWTDGESGWVIRRVWSLVEEVKGTETAAG